jgi:hypothetical protein
VQHTRGITHSQHLQQHQHNKCSNTGCSSRSTVATCGNFMIAGVLLSKINGASCILWSRVAAAGAFQAAIGQEAVKLPALQVLL